MIMRKGKNMIENNEIITTDTEGIYMRDFADTQVPRTFELKGGVQAHTSVTFDVYQYAHNPMELYEANTNQPAVRSKIMKLLILNKHYIRVFL